MKTILIACECWQVIVNVLTDLQPHIFITLDQRNEYGLQKDSVNQLNAHREDNLILEYV